MSFADLGLSPETLKAIEEVGYSTPTPIQAQAIPVVLMGHDVLGLAQTGTGKTAGFTLPMIEILAAGRARARMPRSLIITPTRELAAQIAENFNLYGKYHKLTMALLVGGESFTDQVRLLDRGVDVLIATPGRLLDLFQRGRILLSDVKILVIDEADRMLDMGFIPDVEKIASLLPKNRQTLFFSATMPPEVKRLADVFLTDPKEIRVAAAAAPAATVTQGMVVVDHGDKREALRSLLRKEQVKNAFIFCNRKRDIGTLHRSLVRHGFSAVMLHGDMPQSMRTETLERFKAGESSLMVCSDVAARGLDVTAMSHVFNFDVPIHAEDYVHRIGRTGRAGLEGRAFTIAMPEDGRHVAAIEKLIGKPIPRVEVDGVDQHELEYDDRGGRGRGGRGGERGGDKDRERSRDRDRRPRRSEATEPRREDARREEPRRDEPRRDEPRREEARREEVRRDEPRREEPRREEPRRDDARRDDARRSDRGRPPSRRSMRDDGTGVGAMDHPDDVLAFGDHTPDFFLIKAEIPQAENENDADGDFETEVEVDRFNPPHVDVDVEGEAEAEAVAEAAEVAAGDAEAEAPAGEAEVKPKAKRSRRAKGTGDKEKTAEAEAEKPKRTRAKAAEGKPSPRRRKKADAEAEAVTPSAEAAPAEPAPPPAEEDGSPEPEENHRESA